MKKLFLIIIIAMLFSLLSCCKSPTGPDEYKDPRTYTWTIDTLLYPGSFQTNMRSIWGSSVHDLYIVGHNDRGYGKMFHFDGLKWSAIDPLPTGSIDLASVYGFSPNDIWTVGMEYIEPPGLGYYVDSSLIIHYDGTTWKEMQLPGRGRMLQSVGGATPNDVWAGGTNVLFHFDGVSIKHYPIYIPPQGIQLGFIVALSTSEVYMAGYRNDVTQPLDSSFHYLYRFNGSSWDIIDSTLQGTSQANFGPQLTLIDHQMYSAGGGVWKWIGNGWNKLFDEEWIYHVGGSSANNLFACGGLATLYHYNGTDWKKLALPINQDVAFYTVWTDGVEAFIIGNDGYKTYIVHGK
ncbi:MAG: hypothetical protein ABSB78_00375 [Bacteroidota bacterium]